MTKSLLEIAKENGAFIVKDEVGEDLVLPVENLQATIDVVNAQNKGKLECRFTYLVSELKRLLGLDENYMCLSSAPVEPVLLNFLTEKLNVMNEQSSEPVGEIVCDARTGHTVNIFTGDKPYPNIGTKLYTAPQTLPPEWAEWIELIEGALEDACGGRCNAENNPCWARELLLSKPK